MLSLSQPERYPLEISPDNRNCRITTVFFLLQRIQPIRSLLRSRSQDMKTRQLYKVKFAHNQGRGNIFTLYYVRLILGTLPNCEICTLYLARYRRNWITDVCFSLQRIQPKKSLLRSRSKRSQSQNMKTRQLNKVKFNQIS